MCAHDDTVSPYLLRPLRSYEQAMRDRAARTACKGGRPSVGGADSRGPARRETDDVEPAQ